MQRCILDGHKPVEQQGVGPYAGQLFLVCRECGLLLDLYKTPESLTPGTMSWPPEIRKE